MHRVQKPQKTRPLARENRKKLRNAAALSIFCVCETVTQPETRGIPVFHPAYLLVGGLFAGHSAYSEKAFCPSVTHYCLSQIVGLTMVDKALEKETAASSMEALAKERDEALAREQAAMEARREMERVLAAERGAMARQIENLTLDVNRMRLHAQRFEIWVWVSIVEPGVRRIHWAIHANMHPLKWVRKLRPRSHVNCDLCREKLERV